MSFSLARGGSTTRANVYAGTSAPSAPGTQRTTRPIVTGTSVIGIKYAGGVMLAADTLASYGGMAKYKNAQRLVSVNPKTLIGGGGEYSDFQSLTDLLRANALQDSCTADSLYAEEDGAEECAREVWNYIRAVMYNRRNKMNPLWNDIVVAGFAQDKDGSTGEPFLGLVDKIGTAYGDDMIATGFGSYLALPILREKYRADLEEGEARALLEDCMRVLFYRDCRASNRIQIAKVTKEDGVLISEPYELDTSWDSASFVVPKGELEGDGGW
uniref:Proteasome subunit beta n=1 Tax=Ditylum brightwellii TaxID=49249 RepID=A0A7S4T5H5_9STRA